MRSATPLERRRSGLGRACGPAPTRRETRATPSSSGRRPCWPPCRGRPSPRLSAFFAAVASFAAIAARTFFTWVRTALLTARLRRVRFDSLTVALLGGRMIGHGFPRISGGAESRGSDQRVKRGSALSACATRDRQISASAGYTEPPATPGSGNPERRPPESPVATAIVPVVRLGDAPRDGQPQPGAAGRPPAGPLLVAVEDASPARPRAMPGPVSATSNDDRGLGPSRRHAHADPAPARRELEGVGDEVVERLPELLRVGEHLEVERPLERRARRGGASPPA